MLTSAIFWWRESAQVKVGKATEAREQCTVFAALCMKSALLKKFFCSFINQITDLFSEFDVCWPIDVELSIASINPAHKRNPHSSELLIMMLIHLYTNQRLVKWTTFFNPIIEGQLLIIDCTSAVSLIKNRELYKKFKTKKK